MLKGKKLRINHALAREDLRKLGLAFIIAGFIALFTASISDSLYACLLIVIGSLVWVTGLVEGVTHAGN